MDLHLLSSSPTSVNSPLLDKCKSAVDAGSSSIISRDEQRQQLISMQEFVQEVPKQIQLRKEGSIAAGSKDDPVMRLFHHLRLDDHCHEEWNRFAHFDSHRSYTRNLIATDHVSYTLLLLCWNPGRFSPIHDHPCDGCWMRVLQGQVQECRYKNDSKDKLICTQDKTYKEGGLVFIEDSLGYHKVGNPSCNQPAVTLHLYSPPFESCKIWLDESRKPCESGTICHYSEYGTKI